MRSAFKRSALLALGIGLLTGFDANADQAASAAREMMSLRREGAKAYVNSLYRDGRRWDQILARIESGQRPWLRLAQAMKPGADGSTAEQLQTEIALALTKNPAAVLRVLSTVQTPSTWSVSLSCGAPTPTPGKVWLTRYKARAIRAVAAVGDPDLAERKRACLRALHGIDLSKPAEFYE